jgi:hypothetical protein
MSGSGSTVYGIFAPDINLDMNFPANYLIKKLVGKL